ncbi:MAG TPA: class II fructose-bisphosphatase [Anaerolineae bacterium]|nr:class II fructose-bisphosphatase [Anaerolineae bacterium]
MVKKISPNLGLDLVRVTEAAALTAGRWMGLGNPDEANHWTSVAMANAFNTLAIDGHIVIGEEGKLGVHTPLDSGKRVGMGTGTAMDVVADPIDGAHLLALGHADAIAVAGLAPRGSMWKPYPAVYMDKIVVDKTAAPALVPECMDAPAAWTLALVARAKNKAVRDLIVFVLDRPRHKDLIEEIRAAGARVMSRLEGDIAGALMVVLEDVNVDILMGIGGISEGVIAACAIKSLGGAMLGRLSPQSEGEANEVKASGLDVHKILTCDELVKGDDVFFAATGITDGVILSGVRYEGDRAQTESMVLRRRTGTKRLIHAEHLIESPGEDEIG